MDGHFTPRQTKTTCPYCGVGCGLVVSDHSDGNFSVTGDPDHPANFGRLCSKGAALAETLGLEDRLLAPEIDGRRASWDEALGHVAETFQHTIAEYGPEAVAFYVSGQLLTEDYYVANKLMKGFIGAANIDTNSRLCMASTVAGHNRAFGGDVVPGTYRDLEIADLIVLVGSNLAWCHPVLFQRIIAAKEARPSMKLVVIDPRRTVTAEAADLHLAIRPDGDVALFNGLLRHLHLSGAFDLAFIEEHTNGFADAWAEAMGMDDQALAVETGLEPADFQRFFDWVAKTENTVTVFSQGVNQSASGTDKVNAIINTHLATGRIGRPGMGPFSITGQPNAMGGREVGGLANQLAAHMQLENPEHRDVVRKFWGSPTLAERPGLKAIDLFKAVGDGKVRALWIMATNPVDSLPLAGDVEAAIKACPFVVVSDISRHTDTVRHAHVRLPAAGWGEKDGTVTNSERRVSRQKSFLPYPAEARPDWRIICDVAARMGWEAAFPYTRPAEIYREHAVLSALAANANRAFDISADCAVSDEGYDKFPPRQWPFDRARFLSEDHRFFGAGGFFTPDGRARFIAVKPPEQSKPILGYPLALNTGRIRDQWHTMTRTGKAPQLSHHFAEPFVVLNPDDAAGLGVEAATLVHVRSQNGQVLVRALISDEQSAGSCFMPMHWTDQNTAHGRVGRLIDDQCDPISGQPGLKSSAVRITPYAARWFAFAVTRYKPEHLDTPYWALSPFEHGWRCEFAGDEEMPSWRDFASSLFGGVEGDWIDFSDPSRSSYRFSMTHAGQLVGLLYVSDQPVSASRAWVCSQFDINKNDGAVHSVLAGRVSVGETEEGAIVCSCFNVGAGRIKAEIANGSCRSLDDVGNVLSAGSNCGSCRPEILRFLAEYEDNYIR